MIRTSLHRFYSTTRKQTAKDPKSFPLARPIKPRAAPTPPTPLKEFVPEKEITLYESARATLAPFSFSPYRWFKVFSNKKDTQKSFRTRVEEHRHGKKRATFRVTCSAILYFFNIFVFGHLFQSHVYDAKGTFGPSMLPTLFFEGDWVLINKLYRRGKGVQIGDVVETKDPLRPEGNVLKRIIGMPGDFVLAQSVETSGKMIQIPQGHCFLAGDNQALSKDSRLYGPIPLALITGKVVYRIMPLNRMGKVENTLKLVDEKELFGSI